MLPPDDGVGLDVGNIGDTRAPARLEDHPSHVRPPETELSVVRVEFRVRVSVMLGGNIAYQLPDNGESECNVSETNRAVSPRPPLDAALETAKGGGAFKRIAGEQKGERVAHAPAPTMAK